MPLVKERRKHSAYTLLILSALIAVGPFSMEAYLPAMPMIADELDVSIVRVNLSVSTFLFGLGMGQFFGGPISDQIGRRRNVIGGLSLFCLASVGIIFADHIDQVLALRFLQALGAGFAAVVGMPTVRDIYSPQEAARKIPLVSSVMFIAPIVAPMVGTLLMQWDWRAIFAFLVCYAIAVILFFAFYIGEPREQLSKVSFRRIFVQCKQVLRHRVNGRHIGLRYILIAAFASGAFLTFLTNAAWVYMQYFGLSEFEFPFYFAIHLFSFLLANVLMSRLVARIDPFHILRVACVVQMLSLAALWAWEAFVGVGLYTYIFLLFFTVGPGAVANSCVMAMLFGYFQRLTGSVVSLISLSRSLLGASLGGLSALFFDETLIPALVVMFTSSAICLILVRSLPVDPLKSVVARPKEEGL